VLNPEHRQGLTMGDRVLVRSIFQLWERITQLFGRMLRSKQLRPIWRRMASPTASDKQANDYSTELLPYMTKAYCQ
jgi:hypothetical protein